MRMIAAVPSLLFASLAQANGPTYVVFGGGHAYASQVVAAYCDDRPNCPAPIVENWDCGPAGCGPDDEFKPDTGNDHGTKVSRVLARVTREAEGQLQRQFEFRPRFLVFPNGIGGDPMGWFAATGASGQLRARELGVAAFVDTSAGELNCTGPQDNPQVAALRAAGIIYVQSAGNYGNNGFKNLNGDACPITGTDSYARLSATCDTNKYVVANAIDDSVDSQTGKAFKCVGSQRVDCKECVPYPIHHTSNFGPDVDVAANGCLQGLMNLDTVLCADGTGIGTSFSAPFVAGVFGVGAAINPARTAASVAELGLQAHVSTDTFTVESQPSTNPFAGNTYPYRKIDYAKAFGLWAFLHQEAAQPAIEVSASAPASFTFPADANVATTVRNLTAMDRTVTVSVTAPMGCLPPAPQSLQLSANQVATVQTSIACTATKLLPGPQTFVVSAQSGSQSLTATTSSVLLGVPAAHVVDVCHYGEQPCVIAPGGIIELHKTRGSKELRGMRLRLYPKGNVAFDLDSFIDDSATQQPPIIARGVLYECSSAAVLSETGSSTIPHAQLGNWCPGIQWGGTNSTSTSRDVIVLVSPTAQPAGYWIPYQVTIRLFLD